MKLRQPVYAKLFGLLLCLQLTAPCAPVRLQDAPVKGLNDPKELEAFLDPIFAARMSKLHIPGAVIAIVKDGRIIFTKGYGYADIEKKTPAVPEKTIFRIGSITKVFTAMSVMQLADRGKIKLSDDVNKYLKKVRVPKTYEQPVTFANLLTHTSGLDEISPGRHSSDRSKLVPLEEFLKTRLVRRFQPGDHISYSTYNAALAGYLVEQITGKHLKEYLGENIFGPLGMSRTSITAVPEELRADLATGYEYDGKDYRALPFEWFNTYPASDINSTAVDMARFMMAHLEGGAYEGKRVLSRQAEAMMQSTHFRNHKGLAGWCYGFYETRQNDLRLVEHGGSMDDGYSDLMSLLPEQRFGIYIACNTEAGGFGLAGAVKDAFFDRYFPARAATSETSASAQPEANLEKFAGKYRADIYCHTCPADGRAYVPEPFEVVANKDGTLSFWDTKWRQVEPMLFLSASGPRAGKIRVAFRADREGRVNYMFQDIWAFERAPASGGKP